MDGLVDRSITIRLTANISNCWAYHHLKISSIFLVFLLLVLYNFNFLAVDSFFLSPVTHAGVIDTTTIANPHTKKTTIYLKKKKILLFFIIIYFFFVAYPVLWPFVGCPVVRQNPFLIITNTGVDHPLALAERKTDRLNYLFVCLFFSWLSLYFFRSSVITVTGICSE